MSDEPGNGAELFIMQANIPEFLQVMAVLEQQPRLIKQYSLALPLVRENIEVTHRLEPAALKDYTEKAKKIHQKLYQIQDYQPPRELEDSPDVIAPQEFASLISFLKS